MTSFSLAYIIQQNILKFLREHLTSLLRICMEYFELLVVWGLSLGKEISHACLIYKTYVQISTFLGLLLNFMAWFSSSLWYFRYFMSISARHITCWIYGFKLLRNCFMYLKATALINCILQTSIHNIQDSLNLEKVVFLTFLWFYFISFNTSSHMPISSGWCVNAKYVAISVLSDIWLSNI